MTAVSAAMEAKPRQGARSLTTPRLVLALVCAFVPLGLTNIVAFVLIATLNPTPSWMQSRVAFAFTVYAVSNVIGLIVMYAVLGQERLRNLGVRFRLDKRRVRLSLTGLVIAIVIFPVVNLSLKALGLPIVRGLPLKLSTAETIVLLITVVLIVPFCEEILFRSVWYAGLRDRVGDGLATALATLAFMALHIPWFGIGGMIFIGFWVLVPITLYRRTGDMTASWLMHTLNNLFAYVIMPHTGLPVPGN